MPDSTDKRATAISALERYFDDCDADAGDLLDALAAYLRAPEAIPTPSGSPTTSHDNATTLHPADLLLSAICTTAGIAVMGADRYGPAREACERFVESVRANEGEGGGAKPSDPDRYGVWIYDSAPGWLLDDDEEIVAYPTRDEAAERAHRHEATCGHPCGPLILPPEPLPAAPSHCVTSPFVSRACERGTHGCNVRHDAPSEEGEGPEPREAVMLVDDDGLPKWLSGHEEDHAKGRYRYVPALVVDRLIAAAVAAKDRELADVRDGWRKCRDTLSDAEREIERLRGTLDTISEHRGFVVSAEYGRIEEAEYMRQMANESLQHVPPYVPTSDGRAAPSEEGEGPEVDTSDWQVPPVPESELRRRIAELEADIRRLTSGSAYARLEDAHKALAERAASYIKQRDDAVKRSAEMERHAEALWEESVELEQARAKRDADLAEAWRWIECGREMVEELRARLRVREEWTTWAGNELQRRGRDLEQARAALEWNITKCDVEGCGAWALWYSDYHGERKCDAHKGTTHHGLSAFEGEDEAERRARAAITPSPVRPGGVQCPTERIVKVAANGLPESNTVLDSFS